MEQWVHIPDYPGYEASDLGRIRNVRTGRILTVHGQEDQRPHVGLMFGTIQVKRGLSLLICKTFLGQPNDEFNTPIHLDGDLNNCCVDNLTWRPRWFANQYTEQFRKNLGDTGPVRNIDTQLVYQDVWNAVMTLGVLYNEIVMSIFNKSKVYPIMQRFEWAD